jgi:hypothetical protein
MLFMVLLLIGSVRFQSIGLSESPPAATQTATDASTRPSSSTRTPSVRPLEPSKLYVPDIMRVIHSVRPWPSVEDDVIYTDADWDKLIETAQILKGADPHRLEIALEWYVIHYETSFDPDNDRVAEWSKPLLLLRVMFNVSESEDLTKYHPKGSMGFGGFGMAPVSEDEQIPLTLATPVSFRDKPRLTAVRCGYNGPRYYAEKEYRFFKEHFEFRPLRPAASQPQSTQED